MPRKPPVYDPKNLNKPQIRLPSDEPVPVDEKGIPKGPEWLWDWRWWFAIVALALGTYFGRSLFGG